MSGHSKWHQIKRKKEATDAKRGQQFTKLAAAIKKAAQQNPNPQVNSVLAEAITRAKKANMPQTSIDRLLASASDAATKTTIYEAIAPHGVGLIIITNTDNPNRTVAELRHLLKNHHSTLGQPGSVAWKFVHTPQGYQPSYPIPLKNDSRQQVIDLIDQLTNHPDVAEVFSDLA